MALGLRGSVLCGLRDFVALWLWRVGLLRAPVADLEGAGALVLLLVISSGLGDLLAGRDRSLLLRRGVLAGCARAAG